MSVLLPPLRHYVVMGDKRNNFRMTLIEVSRSSQGQTFHGRAYGLLQRNVLNWSFTPRSAESTHGNDWRELSPSDSSGLHEVPAYERIRYRLHTIGR